jgi:hypothetical protein
MGFTPAITGCEKNSTFRSYRGDLSAFFTNNGAKKPTENRGKT